MSIIFSAIVPHPPVLIPTIGKENITRLEKTVTAYEKLEKELRAQKPDTILIISPHGNILENAFTLNFSSEYTANFEEFGDFSTKLSLGSDIGLIYKIRESLETTTQVQMISEPNLDHGSSVPLYYLTKNLPEIKIIPLNYSQLDLNKHFELGRLIKEELLLSRERIAIIASGDLSHCLTKDAPGGYSPKGKKFDKKLIELLSKDKAKDILEIDEDLINEAAECGLRSIIIMLGIIDGFKYAPVLLSYEAPFGVGYLVMNLKY